MPKDHTTIYCPSCESPIPRGEIDWPKHRAHCRTCDQTLPLTGYIEPPTFGPELFEPRDIERPAGLKLQRRSIPGAETFSFGGMFLKLHIRLERELLVFKGVFGKEQSVPLESVDGFMALQCVTRQCITQGIVAWQVVAVLEGGKIHRIWEAGNREGARYVASELNRALQWM